MATRAPKRTVGNHRNYELVELQTLRDALAADRQHLLGDRARPPAPGGAGQRRQTCWPPSRASTRPPPTARSRRASRCARSSARSRSCCCRRSTSSPPTPTARPSSSSPRRWATGWLHGARRLASAASRPAGILLLDSSRGQDAEEVHAQALDLALRRAGFRVLVLSNELGDERLERALGALDPTAIVLCGPGADTPGRGQAGPQDPRARLRRPALRLPRQRPDRRRRPLGRRAAEPGHRDAQRRPAPPRRPGLRLAKRRPEHWARTGARAQPRSVAPDLRRTPRGLRRRAGRVQDDLRQRREVERRTVFLTLGQCVVDERFEQAFCGAPWGTIA